MEKTSLNVGSGFPSAKVPPSQLVVVCGDSTHSRQGQRRPLGVSRLWSSLSVTFVELSIGSHRLINHCLLIWFCM